MASFANFRYSMGFAAILMGVSVLLSRFMGLIRDKVISWQFGASIEADIYFAAFVIPDFINYLLAGGYVSITLIPLLSERFANDEDDAWNFFSTVLSWACVAVLSLTVIAFIFAPEFAKFSAPGFDEKSLNKLSLYLRIILPAQIFFLLGSCFTAILYIKKAFSIPALTPLIYNGSIIICGLLWPYFVEFFGLSQLQSSHNMTGYAFGVTIGAFIGAFALPLYAVIMANKAKFKLNFKHKLLKKYLYLAIPLMLGQSIVVLDEQLVRIFGSIAEEGTVSLLSYARRIMLVPVGVIAQAAGIASFPFLTSLAAKGDDEGFNNTMHLAMRSTLYLIIPLTIYMMFNSSSILGLIFEGGNFSSSQTKIATPYLQILMISVPFMSIQQIVGRCFYARQDTLSPVIIGSLSTIVFLFFYTSITTQYGGLGLASLSMLGIVFYTIILCFWWIKKFSSIAFKSLIFPGFMISVVASISGYVANHFENIIYNYLNFISYFSYSFISYFVRLSIAFIVFLMSYIFITYLIYPKALKFRRK